jgi:hypothetical protein
MAMNLALEELSEGSDSPPQVGGGPIDELAAHGYGIHKYLSFARSGSRAVEVTATSPRDRSMLRSSW